jgi:hypothetical protein
MVLGINVKNLMLNDEYLSKVVDDKKSWFTPLDVLDLIYHQCFFTANSLGHKPTTSQYVQSNTLQPAARAAVAIHCTLSEYDCGIKATVMFSQDVYQGTFCPSPVINCNLEATILNNPTLVGRLIPPLQCKSVKIGAPQFLSLLLSQD